MPIVRVIHRDWRTIDQKRRLARAIDAAVREHLGAGKVYVVFHAVPNQSFAEDGLLIADFPEAVGRPFTVDEIAR
jgi:phenylpyruvate tautomerase PptA (4-oxalocrotonate tautomerase family)